MLWVPLEAPFTPPGLGFLRVFRRSLLRLQPILAAPLSADQCKKRDWKPIGFGSKTVPPQRNRAFGSYFILPPKKRYLFFEVQPIETVLISMKLYEKTYSIFITTNNK